MTLNTFARYRKPKLSVGKRMSTEVSRRMSIDVGASFTEFTERFHYNDRNHGSDLLFNLRDYWCKRSFCDVTISTGEKEIKAHRIILSTFSPYFAAMFSLNMKEGRDGHEVQLGYLDGEILEKVIDFGYTGEIDIQGEDVFDILSTANFLGMDPLVRGCCMYLMVHMDKDNCLDVLEVADSHGCRELYEAAKLVALHHFVETCRSNRFLFLPPDLVLKLVKDENIVVQKQNLVAPPCEQELEIWHAIENYVNFDLPNRKHYLMEFFRYIRLPLLDCDMLLTVEQSTLIQENGFCMKLLEEAKSLLNQYPGDKDLAWALPNNKVIPWASPRNFADHLYYSSEEIACGGHLRPELQRFDDHDLVDKDGGFVCGMDLYIRSWYGTKVLGGMRICYSNGQETLHGSEECVDKYDFRLKEEERITEVEATAGWMIDSLTFHTNIGRTFGPFGGHGGGKKNVSPQGAFPYLAAVSGIVVNTDRHFGISRLRFIYGHYQFPKPNELLSLRPDLLMPADLLMQGNSSSPNLHPDHAVHCFKDNEM
ncbi:hypothetical protein ScPMuIL_014511 [Solemya velum]